MSSSLQQKAALHLSAMNYIDLFYNWRYTQKNLEKVEQLRKIANEKNAEVAHVVFAWYLTLDSIDVVIPGANSAEQANKHQQSRPKLEQYSLGRLFSPFLDFFEMDAGVP